jgi:hypothetical protein
LRFLPKLSLGLFDAKLRKWVLLFFCFNHTAFTLSRVW